MRRFPEVPTLVEAERIVRKNGLDTKDASLWKLKWRRLRNGHNSGADCWLSFHQYLRLATKTGIQSPHEIGVHNGQYQMSRKGDTGDYEIGNCRFKTAEENREEKRTNGGTARAGEKTSIHLRGRTKETHASIASQAEKMRGRTKDTHAGIAEQARKVSRILRGRTKENDPGYAAISLSLRGRTKKNDPNVARIALLNSKHFKVTSPKGKVKTGRNLKAFCEKNRLDLSTMSKVCRGKRPSHKGWTGTFV